MNTVASYTIRFIITVALLIIILLLANSIVSAAPAIKPAAWLPIVRTGCRAGMFFYPPAQACVIIN